MEVADGVLINQRRECGITFAGAGHTIGEGVAAKVNAAAADVHFNAVRGVGATSSGEAHPVYEVVVLDGVISDGDVTVLVIANEDTRFQVGVFADLHARHGVA